MKNLVLFFASFFGFGLSMSGQTPNILQGESYVIGINKISQVQLQFVKGDLVDMSKVASAQYVFKDNLLLVRPDSTTTPILEYAEVERILLKYFSVNDIYRKNNMKTNQLQAEYIKSDKYIIK